MGQLTFIVGLGLRPSRWVRLDPPLHQDPGADRLRRGGRREVTRLPLLVVDGLDDDKVVPVDLSKEFDKNKRSLRHQDVFLGLLYKVRCHQVNTVLLTPIEISHKGNTRNIPGMGHRHIFDINVP